MRKTKVVLVANSKGGVGKSTIADNLAVAAALEGKSVLLVDVDPQGSSKAFRSIRATDDIKMISINKPTIHKDIESFSNFDIIIIDAGGRDNGLLRSALLAVPRTKGILLIPLLPSQYDVWATEDLFEILGDLRISYDIPSYVVLNKLVQNTVSGKEAKEFLSDLTQEHNLTMLDTTLVFRQDYINCVSKGQGVLEFKPKGQAAAEITNLYAEVMSLFKEE